MNIVEKRKETGRLRVKWMPEGESKTQQHFKKKCDVNSILARYAKTGVLDHVRQVQGAYGDYSSVASYQEALEKVFSAEQAFNALPAQIRKRFNNSPVELLKFVSEEKNRDEAISLGLVEDKNVQGVPKGTPAPGGQAETPPSQPSPAVGTPKAPNAAS